MPIPGTLEGTFHKGVFFFFLISAVEQSDSVTFTFFFIFSCILVYHRILNIVPCSIL